MLVSRVSYIRFRFSIFGNVLTLQRPTMNDEIYFILDKVKR